MRQPHLVSTGNPPWEHTYRVDRAERNVPETKVTAASPAPPQPSFSFYRHKISNPTSSSRQRHICVFNSCCCCPACVVTKLGTLRGSPEILTQPRRLTALESTQHAGNPDWDNLIRQGGPCATGALLKQFIGPICESNTIRQRRANETTALKN